MSQSSVDFVVVGAGIAGASAAYFLSDKGSVTILEAESQPGYHTTGRSAAFLSAAYGNAIIRALTTGSREFLSNPPDRFCEQPLLRKSGALYIAGPAQIESLERHVENVSKLPVTVTRESPDFAKQKLPALRTDLLSACIWEPGASEIDVNELLQGYLRGARQRGAKLVCNARVQEMRRKNGTWQIVTIAGEFVAPVVINAAGAWADEIGRIAGAKSVGLSPKRRTVCLFDPPAGMDISAWPLVVDIDERFYFKADAGKILLSPADETPVQPHDAYPEDIDVAIAVERFEQATTITVPRIDHSWAGLRSFVADKTPVVGFDKNLDGFFWLAGQGGYGIQTSPGMARCAGALILGDEIPADFVAMDVSSDALAPARFQK